MKLGLVLEGGGMRGLYTDGVLDCLMDRGVTVDDVIGVSAGACGGVSYVSGQRGRSHRINTAYLRDKRYVGFSSFLKTGSVFGMDFLFDEVANRLDPLDYQALADAPMEFVTGVTDVSTGQPAYFDKSVYTRGGCQVLRASCAIPLFSPVVEWEGGRYLDGGVSDPIPLKKALADGCDQLIVVLTRHRGYRKKPEGLQAAYRWAFRKDPAMAQAIARRPQVYNDTLDLLWKLEREHRALVIAPSHPVTVGRFEKSLQKLEALYKEGMLDAQIALTRLASWPGQGPEPDAPSEPL